MMAFGTALAQLFLLPGNIACTGLGLDRDDKRDLVRMLVNSLVWTVLGVIFVALVA